MKKLIVKKNKQKWSNVNKSPLIFIILKPHNKMKKFKLSKKIQATLSLIIYTLAGAMCIICFSKCAAQTPKEQPANAIIFEFSNVDSCAYVWDDGCFLIWYDDADAFDYEAMAWRSGREEWYGEFLYLDIEDSLVGEFLQDFHKYIELRTDYKKNWEAMDELSQHWGIVNWDKSSESYELIRMEGDWWYR